MTFSEDNDPTRNLFEGWTPEKPSDDFTERVMHEIKAPSSVSLNTAPIIGRWGWAGIGTAVVGIILATYVGSANFQTAWWKTYFSGLDRVSWRPPEVELSATTGIILLSSVAIAWGFILIDRVYRINSYSDT
ncbi:MAG: hypothetical protein ACFB10_22210 [Salibacteraceae bacterium]